MPSQMPSLFLPHGAPTVALAPGDLGPVLADLGAALPRPRAIVIISPHWQAARATVGFAAAPETIHDFHGFPEALYALRYPARGDTSASETVLAALARAGLDPLADAERGLDHGAWIPLRMAFPRADIPVVPVSLQGRDGVEGAWRLGCALAPLVNAGFLVVGSGNLTHNLQDWRRVAGVGAQVPKYVTAFPAWIADRLAAGDHQALLDYRTCAPGGARAHPTDEHLLPFYVALGAAGVSVQARRLYAGVDSGVIAMDAWAFLGAKPSQTH